jgi:GH15 family glucan-1,4-alpha-glucosidase
MDRTPLDRVEQLGELDPVTRQSLVTAAGTAAVRKERDQGIWEIRGEPRDFLLYSKLMCWVALDRAIALAEPLEATDR